MWLVDTPTSFSPSSTKKSIFFCAQLLWSGVPGLRLEMIHKLVTLARMGCRLGRPMIEIIVAGNCEVVWAGSFAWLRWRVIPNDRIEGRL